MKLDHSDLLFGLYYLVNGVLFFGHQYRASLVASCVFGAIGMVAVCRESVQKHKIYIVSR